MSVRMSTGTSIQESQEDIEDGNAPSSPGTGKGFNKDVRGLKYLWHYLGPSLLSVLAYASCSISMIFLNKIILSVYHFRQTLVLLAIQNMFALVWTLLINRCRVQGLSLERSFKWAPVNLAFLFMLYTSFKGLQHLTVPVVTVLKNLTNILILAVDWYFYGQKVNWQVITCIAMMALGAFFMSYNDLAFDAAGYMWMGANCVSTAFYVAYVKRAMSYLGFSKNDATIYNNMMSFPMSFALIFLLGDFDGAWNNPLWQNKGFVSAVVASGLVGYMLGLSSFWCVKQTSPTTYSIVGTSNKAVIALIGFLLDPTALSFKGTLFVILNLSGGSLYGYSKARERATPDAPKENDSPPPKQVGTA